MLFPLQTYVDALHVRIGARFAIRPPDGSRYCCGSSAPTFTFVFHNDAALLSAFTRGHMGLLESYFDLGVDVEGDFAAALAAGLLSGMDAHFKTLHSLENGLHELRFSNHDAVQAKANARAH